MNARTRIRLVVSALVFGPLAAHAGEPAPAPGPSASSPPAKAADPAPPADPAPGAPEPSAPAEPPSATPSDPELPPPPSPAPTAPPTAPAPPPGEPPAPVAPEPAPLPGAGSPAPGAPVAPPAPAPLPPPPGTGTVTPVAPAPPPSGPPPSAAFPPAPTVSAPPPRESAGPPVPAAVSPSPAVTEPRASEPRARSSGARPADQAARAPDQGTSSHSDQGLFGPFRIGVLVGGGLPSLVSFAGEIRLTRYFGAGVRFGLIPTVHFSYYGEATVSHHDYGAYAHIHPFGGGFLLGAELGYALIKGTYRSSVNTTQYAAYGAPSSIDISTDGRVQTLVLTPELGYIYTWKAGFTFGFDVGAQIPVASSHVSFVDHIDAGGLPQSVVDQLFAPDREKVRSTLGKVGQTVLPTIHLRIGWLL